MKLNERTAIITIMLPIQSVSCNWRWNKITEPIVAAKGSKASKKPAVDAET